MGNKDLSALQKGASTYVIKNFEGSIEKLAILAAIMPIIASMGGCSGTQSLTTAVRAIAMKQLTWSNALRSTGKEVVVGLLNGIIFSVTSFIVTFLWFNDYGLSFVISVSLLLNLIFGSFFGTFIPIILTRVGQKSNSVQNFMWTSGHTTVCKKSNDVRVKNI